MSASSSLTQGLRELADFLDAHPEIDASVQSYNVFVRTSAELAKIARLTSWEKKYDGAYFMLRKTFSDGLNLDINIQRQEVCKRVVIGRQVIPAVTIPEYTEDVIEWQCADSSILQAADVAKFAGRHEGPSTDEM